MLTRSTLHRTLACLVVMLAISASVSVGIPAAGAAGVATISAGYFHTCAVTSQGDANCWGFNGDGELGDGTTTSKSIPVKVVDVTGGLTAISTDAYHTCAVTSTGGAKCWGYNFFGELGDGSTNESSIPP